MRVSSNPRYRPSLIVYVAWHPSSASTPDAGTLARTLQACLNRDPGDLLSRGIGIPVFFRSVPEKNGAPREIPLDAADQTVAILLIDDAFIVDPAFEGFARRVAASVAESGGRHQLIPVHLGSNSLHLGNWNMLRLADVPPEDQGSRLTTLVVHALCRRLIAHTRARMEAGSTPLSPAPVQLFLSHAKRDHGKELAERFRAAITGHPALDVETFFDTRDIPVGTDFAREIEGQIERSAVVAFQTDAYASRPWCRREILHAKKNGVPVIVVNAVASREDRSFPYLGNTPSLRWDPLGVDRSRDVLELTLREVLRSAYSRFHLASLQAARWIPMDAELRPRLPEVITCLAPSTPSREVGPSRLVVYPDPPLGHEEMELLANANPTLRLSTPTALVVQRLPNGKAPFEGRRIALSISESEELQHLGFSVDHLNAVAIELARHLLAAGATLLYGGDLRSRGFTEALIDLVLEHRRTARELDGSIVSFLAWPESTRLSVGLEASVRPQLVFRRLSEKTGLTPRQQQDVLDRLEIVRVSGKGLAGASLDDRERLASNLSAMRQEMAREADARIVLGGRQAGYAGFMPGIGEEAYLTMQSERPVFVAGAFGGCAAALAASLRGSATASMRGAATEEAMELADRRRCREGVRPVDCVQVDQFLRSAGIEGLQNGLTPEENEALFETPHMPELISLVMTGLSRIWAP